LDEVGVADAGAGLPAARPTLGAAEPLTGELVVNLTWGTVTWVERTEVVDELGMREPDELPVEYVQGTVIVVWREMVVTGAAGAAGAVTGELEDATTGALETAEDTAEVAGALDAADTTEDTTEDTAEDTAEVAGVVTAGAVAAGVGTSVMVVGTLVMIPGFFST